MLILPGETPRIARSGLLVYAVVVALSLMTACSGSGEGAGEEETAQAFFDDNGFPDALTSAGFVDPGNIPLVLADLDGSSLHAGANTSALLSGAVIGDGSRVNGELVRTLPFQVDDIGQLQLASVRRVDGGIVAIVRNADSRTRCGAALSGIRLLDANAEALPESRLPSLVNGQGFASASRGGAGLDETSTCLAPNAIASILVTVAQGAEDVFALAASASGFLFEPVDALVGVGIPAVVPLDYALDPAGTLAFRLVNRRGVSMEVQSAFLLALDDDGLPLMHRFIPLPDFSLLPGEERVVETDVLLDFSGRATRVRLFVDSR